MERDSPVWRSKTDDEVLAAAGALAEYTGTIIMVSHDRYFLDKLATEILHFESGAATYHAGSYSDYYAAHHRTQVTVQDVTHQRKRPQARRVKGAVNRTAEPERRSAEEVEREIRFLEDELAQLTERLSVASADWQPEQYAEIGARQDEISAQLKGLYAEWESSASPNN